MTAESRSPAPAPGRAFALASALGYGAALPLSRLAFDEGTNALTVAVLRYVALGAVLGCWIGFRRGGRTLNAREVVLGLALGACFAGVSLGTLLGSTAMSVSLTVLIFYTHPSLILLAAAVLDRRAPRPAELGALALAFAGLVLALDVTLATVSVAGCAFAALAALSALASFVIIERPLRDADSVRTTGVAALGGAVTSGLALAAWGQPALPATGTGWALLSVVVVMFAAAVLCMFLAIRLAGAVRASMLLFLEPVTAILMALLLLGERLSASQWLGAAMVIVAVALASRLGPATHPEEVVS